MMLPKIEDGYLNIRGLNLVRLLSGLMKHALKKQRNTGLAQNLQKRQEPHIE